MPFSIDFFSILPVTMLAFLSFVVGIVFTVIMFGGEELIICIIISAEISWVLYFLVAFYGKKTKLPDGRKLMRYRKRWKIEQTFS